jgi:Alcohol dehydrogenase GroES-like domain
MRHTRIIVTHYGGPDALRVVEEECPEPKDGEVRVRVLAAGVSLPDIMAREGVHPETPPLPFTPGWDLVGVVDRLGNGVSGIELGQIVAALPIHGAYAEFVCLPQRDLVPVPFGLDAAEAVSLVLNYITAYQMLHRSAKVRSGQRVLIHGAAGGVGTALLQLGSRRAGDVRYLFIAKCAGPAPLVQLRAPSAPQPLVTLRTRILEAIAHALYREWFVHFRSPRPRKPCPRRLPTRRCPLDHHLGGGAVRKKRFTYRLDHQTAFRRASSFTKS